MLRDSHGDAGKVLLPAINNMIDICTTRIMALQNHPPGIISIAVHPGLDLLVDGRLSHGGRAEPELAPHS